MRSMYDKYSKKIKKEERKMKELQSKFDLLMKYLPIDKNS